MSAGTESARESSGGVDAARKSSDDWRVRLEVILKEILAAKDLEFNAERPLRDQGFDSADTLTLLSEVESQFNLTLDDTDVDTSNFIDIQSVAALLIRKLGEAPPKLR